MAISVYPVTPSFAAEIGDLDLSRPLDAADVAAVKQAFSTYAVLTFPQQKLTQEQHLAFAGLFGPLEMTIAVQRSYCRKSCSVPRTTSVGDGRKSAGARLP